MTAAHGPEAIRLVDEALTVSDLVLPSPLLANITGHAIDVIKGRDRTAAIDSLVLRWDLPRPTAAKYLDLAVEALTAQEK